MMLRRITGNSMAPTLKPGKIILVSKWLYTPKVNDIVMIRHQGLDKVKRIQTVSTHFIKVIGDNTEESTDSRHFGSIPLTTVVGKVYTFNIRF